MTLLFPLISIKDNNYKDIHIIGSDKHDSLYIDKKTGGIHYLNLQCYCGSEKFENQSAFEFLGIKSQYDNNLQIEFVTFEKLEKMYKKFQK